MRLILIFFFIFLTALPVAAQSGMGGVIEGLSRPSEGDADRMVRASSLSPADLASLLRRSVFGASRSEALVRLSEKNPGGPGQPGTVFSPDALRPPQQPLRTYA